MPVKIIRKKSVQITAKTRKPPKKPPRQPAELKQGRTPSYAGLRKELGIERMAMIESRLLNGETGEEVAKTVKLEWGLMKTNTLVSLGIVLNAYRREVVLTKLMALTDKDTPSMAMVSDRIDVLDNLTKLVELQHGRVNKAIRAEKENGTSTPLNRTTKFEMQLLANLYKQLSDLQMDMGLIRKVATKFTLEGTSAQTQQALEQAMQRSVRRDDALNRAFAVLDGKFKVLPDATTVKH